ncbi:MAG: hypothetical protein RI918_1392 [Pseudomonadota bacterium]|jgi:hypothetical protein
MEKTTSHAQATKLWQRIKQGVYVVGLGLLVSCGSSSSTDDIALSKGASGMTATQVAKYESERVSLLDSLDELYPNGQLSQEQAAAAGEGLAQNPAALKATTPNNSQDIFYSQAGVSLVGTDFLPVYRIQNTTLSGSYFFTIYESEKTAALAANADWKYEGPAFYATVIQGDGLSPVWRFRNKINGSYLFTIYESERADIASKYAATFEYEGISWYASKTAAAGYSPLHRFRNLTNGTYLFSAYESEKNEIIANYPAIFAYEGISYYVRTAPPTSDNNLNALISSVTPAAATLNTATVFDVKGKNLPLTATLAVKDATCLSPVSNTATGFTQTCTPGGVAGAKTITIKTATGGTVIDATRTVTVTATPVTIGLLTDTGITANQCYGAGSNTLISCTSEAAIALNDMQDGMLDRDFNTPNAADGKLGFSYSTVSSYPITDCVKDNITGRMWEGKPTTGLRANTLTFTNLGNNAANDASAYVAAVNSGAGLCGFTNWRLPTRTELQSLVDYSVARSVPTIDSKWFPNTVGNGYYWSASTYAGDVTNAWSVYFYFGSLVSSLRTDRGPVRLVR